MKKVLLLLLIHITIRVFASDTLRVSHLGEVRRLGQKLSEQIPSSDGRRAQLYYTLQNDLSKSVFIDLKAPSADCIKAVIRGTLSDTTIVSGSYLNAMHWPFPENTAIIRSINVFFVNELANRFHDAVIGVPAIFIELLPGKDRPQKQANT